MKLDRNANPEGEGKYALVLLREISDTPHQDVTAALETLETYGLIDYGTGPLSEFFVIRLRDKYASAALYAYATRVVLDGGDLEWATEIEELGKRALNNPHTHTPD